MRKDESYSNLATLPIPVPTLLIWEAPRSLLNIIGVIHPLINDFKTPCL